MKIKANEIKSETIREAIREIEEKYGISGDKAEAIASHIIYTDEDWTDEEEVTEKEKPVEETAKKTLTGKETKTISGISDIELYFSATPDQISGSYREKIESGEMWLEVELDHDNQSAMWSFEENNNSHTSVEDDYEGVLDFFGIEEEEPETEEELNPYKTFAFDELSLGAQKIAIEKEKTFVSLFSAQNGFGDDHLRNSRYKEDGSLAFSQNKGK